MTDQPKQKILIYLDQCIVSDIADGRLNGLLNLIRSGNMQLIYSYVHISETARCSNQAFQSKVIQALTTMGGAFIQEGKLHFDKTPQLRLDEHLENPKVYSELSGSMEKIAHKFFGGQQGKTFKSLIDAQHKPFADLMQHMKINIAELSGSDEPEIQQLLPLLKTLPELTQRAFEEQYLSLTNTLEASIPSHETFNGSKEFRAFVGVDSNPLSNISAPDVLKKIWQKVCAAGNIPTQFSSATDFLEKGVWVHMQDDDPTWEAKISSLYHLLNWIGYCPDEELLKEKGFRSSMGDQTHAAFAASSQVFITSDRRMARKVYAIYEHLGILTQVCLCKTDKNGVASLISGKEIFQKT